MLNIPKITTETSEKISELWIQYHLSQDVLSAVIPEHVYRKLLERSKLYPMV